MPDEHKGSTVMTNVTKIYKKKHVTTVRLTTVPFHSTAVHAGNVINVCSALLSRQAPPFLLLFSFSISQNSIMYSYIYMRDYLSPV